MIALRPQTAADAEFLCALYATTRRDELAQIAWTDAQKDAFVRHQFAAQTAHYVEHYQGATLDVIEQDGAPIGRLYVHEGPSELRIMDIALVPAATGRGLGTQLIADVLARARASGKAASIHVEQFNPARKLYERLGFQPVDQTGVYILMRWSPV